MFIFKSEKGTLLGNPSSATTTHRLSSTKSRLATTKQGCGVGVVRSRRLLGGVGVGFLTTLGVGVGLLCPTPTPDAQLDHFVHHTLKLGIPVEIVQLLLKLLLNQRFIAVYHDFL